MYLDITVIQVINSEFTPLILHGLTSFRNYNFISDNHYWLYEEISHLFLVMWNLRQHTEYAKQKQDVIQFRRKMDGKMDRKKELIPYLLCSLCYLHGYKTEKCYEWTNHFNFLYPMHVLCNSTLIPSPQTSTMGITKKEKAVSHLSFFFLWKVLDHKENLTKSCRFSCHLLLLYLYADIYCL